MKRIIALLKNISLTEFTEYDGEYYYPNEGAVHAYEISGLCIDFLIGNNTKEADDIVMNKFEELAKANGLDVKIIYRTLNDERNGYSGATLEYHYDKYTTLHIDFYDEYQSCIDTFKDCCDYAMEEENECYIEEDATYEEIIEAKLGHLNNLLHNILFVQHEVSIDYDVWFSNSYGYIELQDPSDCDVVSELLTDIFSDGCGTLDKTAMDVLEEFLFKGFEVHIDEVPCYGDDEAPNAMCTFGDHIIRFFI